MALWLPGGLVMLALTLVSGFFSGSETALFFLSPEDQRELARGSAPQRAAARLLDRPDRLLSAVLFWNLLTNLTYFVVSVVVAEAMLHEGYATAAGIVGLGGLASIILLGEVFPKSVAVAAPKAVAGLVALPLGLAVRAVDPLSPRLDALTRALTRTFWPKLETEEYLSADDLEHAVEAATATRELAGPERQVLRNLLDLSNVTAEEIMRPRGTYLTLPSPVRRSHLGGRAPAGGFVAVVDPAEPPEDGSPPPNPSAADAQRVLMLDSASAALGPDPNDPDPRLDGRAVPLPFLPWCASAAAAWALLSETGRPAAGVVNEYGETVGVVTFDDVVDAVLRPDASRARRLLRSDPIRLRQESADETPSWEVAGLTTLRYLLKRLDLPDDLSETDPVTVTGLLLEELEQLPELGDGCEWHGLRLTVEEVVGPDVRRVRVERVADEPVSPAVSRSGGRSSGRGDGA
ncbi:CNNM domain-containing protein [Alienimonas sp. DA493]|uniref:CNNM domain-containing protein n=1 Tax=Alienimonas sp. DA493 TaxID=3373605 RepID=UPI003754E8D9